MSDTPAPAPVSGASSGPAVDRAGTPVVDPTKNVLDLVGADANRQDQLLALHMQRIDDLMAANQLRVDDLRAARDRRQDDLREAESRHLHELATIRATYEELLRDKESKRLNDIRAVDVNAVAEASRVAAAQAITLANQVATSADTLRAQVNTVATATATALTTALQPLQEAISDLRKTQYEAAGGKANRTEAGMSSQWMVGLFVTAAIVIANIAAAYVTKK